MKWTNEERSLIVRHWATKYRLESSDIEELQSVLPGRTLSQIKDQYRLIIRPQVMNQFQSVPSPSPSSPSTPQKRCKRSSSEEA